MTDLDKLNAIITKARWVRKSTGITPREFMLADLVEALATEMKTLVGQLTPVDIPAYFHDEFPLHHPYRPEVAKRGEWRGR